MSNKTVSGTKFVVSTKKSVDGDITALCGEWGVDSKHVAREAILADTYAYRSGASPIEVVEDTQVTDGFYLRTVADGSSGNNLDELPDC